MKGIVLAGGKGTRLYPTTQVVSKQLLPIYDKPMIYYPLSVLMLANIREILIISTPKDLPLIQDLLGNGNSYGLELSYKIQEKPNGIAESFIIAEEFIGRDNVCLILGDNIFYGHDLIKLLEISVDRIEKKNGCVIFGYYVKNPEVYGVVEFDTKCNVLSIEEKPKQPKSNYAVAGLYFYDNNVIEIAKNIKPSHRNELEITSVNQDYLSRKKLIIEIVGRGCAWLDTGTSDSLMAASLFVQTIEQRYGLKLACLEEIAYCKGWITKEIVYEKLKLLENSDYGQYLQDVLSRRHA